MHAAVLAVFALSLGVAACDAGPCTDGDPENNAGTWCGADPDDTEYRGEAFETYALAGADDHFVALIEYRDFRTEASYVTNTIVDIDGSGAVLSVADTDLEVKAPALAADGRGSMVVLDDGRARFLRDGVSLTDAAVGDHTAVTFGAGAYWFATASDPRQLLRYDTNGALLSTLPFRDGASARRPVQPSLATDPLGDDLAASWILEGADSATVVVHRIHDNVAAAFEIAEVPSSAGRTLWASRVAIRDGTIAIIFGHVDHPATIALLSPDGQVRTERITVGATCMASGSQFIGTPAGYLLTCGRQFVMFDAALTTRTITEAPYHALSANARGAALVVSDTDDNSVETRSISDSVEKPVVVFEGHSEEVGCSATRSSSSWLVGILLVCVLGRRRANDARCARRSSSSASP